VRCLYHPGEQLEKARQPIAGVIGLHWDDLDLEIVPLATLPDVVREPEQTKMVEPT
jgi:hypothetical protein